MLSFINMGSRKKRQRRKGSPRSSIGASARGSRRASRGSGSFMSPGNIGEVAEQQSTRRPISREAQGRNRMMGRKTAGAASTEAPTIPSRSPEIQLEFKHDSLLQSLPGDFLKYRKGSPSSLQSTGAMWSPSKNASRTLNTDASPQGKRLNQERRRMAPLPTVAPIKIPASSATSSSTRTQRRKSRTRRSITSNSPAWASDSEISPVSGLSAAQDVLSGTFSFVTRPAGLPELSTKEKEPGNRTARQDSATLPRDAVWEGGVGVRSSTVSRKSSIHSVKKRKLDQGTTGLPPLEAFVQVSPRLRKSGRNEKEKTEDNDTEHIAPPPRKDSITPQGQDGTRGSLGRGPQPPGLTLGAQRLGYVDQAALHRISRILETDAEASSMPSSQPGSGSTTGSFPNSANKGAHVTAVRIAPGSPLKVPSVLSTPSTYSKYTASLYTSPEKRPEFTPACSTSDDEYESFLEDFDFVSPSSGPSSRGDKSGYSGGSTSPYSSQVPMTAASVSSLSGLKSAPVMGVSGFPHGSPRHPPLRKMGSAMTTDTNLGQASSSSSPSLVRKANGATGPKCESSETRESISSPVARAGKSPLAMTRENSQIARNNLGKSVTPIDGSGQRQARNARDPQPTLKISVSKSYDTGTDNLRASRFHVTNPAPNQSPASTLLSPLSVRSPDILDILIPNGHIITPISQKRSGSIPRPIMITPPRSDRYVPTNAYEDDDTIGQKTRSGEPECSLPFEDTPGTGGTQTFPETPVLFSPDFAKDSVSRSNSVLSAANQPYAASCSFARNAITFQPIVIPSAPRVAELVKETPISYADHDRSSNKNALKPQSTIESSSPPISPLQPPPSVPAAPIPEIQTLINTSRPSPPLIGPVPKRRTIHVRPPLPFGPRKPNSSIGKGTAPLSFTPRRSASESAAGISQAVKNMKPLLSKPEALPSTPSFKTTPAPWRGLTLEAAKWTFSSAQLQATVRVAIEQTSHASSIRLLPPDKFEELPKSLSQLEARRTEIQNEYKVMVRRRRSVLHRLTSLASNGPRVDVALITRCADELEALTTTGDRLAEQLHDIDNQITQVHRLRDVHQASALAVALRKLNSSLSRQASETQALQLAVTNLYAERDDAWRKAEELERELDDLHEQNGSTRPKSMSSSRRSSRVSLARKNSSRTTKAGLRLSGHSFRGSSVRSSNSSLCVHHSTSARTTFSSDMIPPVPPLPILEQHAFMNSTNLPLSRPSTSMPQSSAMPSTSELYNDVYNLLGVQISDRALPSPGRPRSAVVSTTSPTNDANTVEQHSVDSKLVPPSFPACATRFRSGSLPSVASPPQNAMEETGAILAVLDFRD